MGDGKDESDGSTGYFRGGSPIGRRLPSQARLPSVVGGRRRLGLARPMEYMLQAAGSPVPADGGTGAAMSLAKFGKSAAKAFRRVRRACLGGRRILILGDSHAGVFEYIFDRDLLAPHIVNCEIVGGATACGLNNDRSLTGAFAIYQRSLQRFADFDVVVLMLGEVDCSFAFWNRAQHRGESVFEQIPRAIQGIERLLDWASCRNGRLRFVLAGSILPTVKDDQVDQQYEVRRSVRATQSERTALVLAYNDALRALATQRSLPYIDITAPTRDPDTGLVRDEFLVRDAVDIHQSQPATAGLWVRELRDVLAAMVRRAA